MRPSLLRLAIAACTPALALLWLACGEKYAGTEPSDLDSGANEGSAAETSLLDSADAGDGDGAPCDPSTPFESVMALPVVNTPANEAYPTLTDDELTMYFQRGPASGNHSFYVAQRSSTAVDFGQPVAVAELNDGAFNTHASITANGDTIFFSTFPSGGAFELRVSTRGSTGRFGPAATIPALDSFGGESAPSVFARGEELWFSTDADAGYHFRRTTRLPNGAFTAPQAVSDLDTPDGEFVIASSRDGLTVYIGTQRQGGLGDVDIWVARRQSRSTAFKAAAFVPSASSIAVDLPSWLSADNCRLYLTSARLGTDDIFVATRRPIP
jgi:hypothetical protein